MNANDLTFGVELETTIPMGAIQVGQYHGNTQAQGLPEGWRAMHDGSIRGRGGRVGCEFVSPVLKGAEGLQSLKDAVAAINAMGGSVNESCGFHVHVGWNGDAASLDRLVTLFANFEKALFAVTGTKRRETGAWTRSVQRYGNRQNAVANARNNRYHALNLSNLGRRQETVEFRVFAGTLNIVKIIGYVLMCLAIVERAHKAKRMTNFVAKAPVESSPIKRGGDGLTTLNRFFYQMGWTKGRADYVYGDVIAEGRPTIKSIKAKLVEMARKYDAQ